MQRTYYGEESNIGAIDPQFNGISCDAVLEEFEQAFNDIKADPSKTPLWQVIIGKYHPTFLGDCKRRKIGPSRWLNLG